MNAENASTAWMVGSGVGQTPGFQMYTIGFANDDVKQSSEGQTGLTLVRIQRRTKGFI